MRRIATVTAIKTMMRQKSTVVAIVDDVKAIGMNAESLSLREGIIAESIEKIEGAFPLNLRTETTTMDVEKGMTDVSLHLAGTHHIMKNDAVIHREGDGQDP